MFCKGLMTYTCGQPCGFCLPYWETHCQYIGHDNLQDACGHADDAGLRIMNYPCSLHRGLTDRNLSGPTIPQDGTVNMWKHDSPRGHDILRDRWVRDGSLCEKDTNKPANMADMNWTRWFAYGDNIVTRHQTRDRQFGAEYAADALPWEYARPGGRVTW